MWKCNWWEAYRTDATVKNHLRASFPYQRLPAKNDSCKRIKVERFFGYVQCDLKVPEHLKAYFPNSPPTFKNTVVSRNDIGDMMKKIAEKEGIMSQSRRMLKSNFYLNNGIINTSFLKFYLHLGLETTKKSSIRSVYSQELLQ